MARLRDFAKKFGIKSPYFHQRQKLEEAIKTGRLAPYCGLERYSDEVGKVLGSDSLDAAEIAIAIEEYGRPMRTIGELLRMLEELDGEHTSETR